MTGPEDRGMTGGDQIHAEGPSGGTTMRTVDFDYDLPSELIAQRPAKRREESRLV